jgi:uncharacterized protein YjbI with pentapeptide repeats
MTAGQFKETVSRGAPLRFAPNTADAERTIEASWLTETDIRLDVEGAIIAGDLTWCDSRIEHPWVFKRCTFNSIDLSGSVFTSAVRFAGCNCKGAVRFDRCRFLNGLLCNPCELGGIKTETKFQSFRMVAARVTGDCEFVGAYFGKAKFARMRVDDELRFSDSKSHANFKGNVSFLQMRVGGELMLDGCAFEGEADFYNIEVSGPAFFRATRFEGKDAIVRFRHTRFRDEVNGRSELCASKWRSQTER